MPAPRAISDLASAHALFAGLSVGCREYVGVAYLDPNRRILALRYGIGAWSHAPVSIGGIVRDAMGFGAAGLVMAHSHPSGDPTPSDRDVAFTVLLARTLRAVGVELFDHLVIAGDRVVSLRGRGVL